MAEDANTPARATVASATAIAEQALESAQLAHQVSEAQAADLTAQAKVLANIQKEQLALAKLVNGLNEQKGSLVKPSQLDGIMARLEKVEQNTKGATHDWAPAFRKVEEFLTDYGQRLTGLEERPAISADTGTPEELTELSAKVDSLAAGLGEVAKLVGTFGQQGDAFQANVYQRLTVLEQGGGVRVASQQVGAKVLELMKEVEFIGKSREAKIETRGDNFSYMFRGIDDAQDAVGTAMRKVGLIMRTQVVNLDYKLTPVERRYANGGGQTQLYSTCVLTMRYSFVDPVDMSEFAFEMVGEGKDISDKSASKAASMACKYALFQALMIPVKGVVESDGEDPQIVSDQPEPTPGARVNSGEITPAQAVQEYQQQATSNQAAQPPVDESARRTRAAAAKQAVEVLHKMPDPHEAMARLNKITDQVKRENLGNIQVGDLQLGEWITAQWKVLKGLIELHNRGGDQGATRQDVDPGHQQARPQAQDAPPPAPPSDDPWGNYTPPPGSEY